MGALTGYFDVAQVVLYVFWLFFAGLIYYLHREDKREGYPLESDTASGRYPIQGFPAIPVPKTFKLSNGELIYAPKQKPEKDLREIKAKPASRAVGAPLIPTGNPMQDGVGPASYAQRSDHPDVMLDGLPLIVPLRVAPGFFVATEDPDPRGMPIFGADRKQGGTVKDVWVDRAEPQIRYLEVAVDGAGTVLLPIHFSKFDIGARCVRVKSILSTQFSGVPKLKSPDQVSLLEEDMITAYYAGGTLYATPARSEPFI